MADFWKRRWGRVGLAAGLAILVCALVYGGPRTSWAEPVEDTQQEPGESQPSADLPLQGRQAEPRPSGANHPERIQTTKPATQLTSLTAEINELSHELDRAVELLEHDPDPAVRVIVDQVRNRLESIRKSTLNSPQK